MTGHLQGKIWGKTKCIVENAFCEMHHVNAKKGGTSSKHLHNFKSNVFFVIKGELLIKVWKNNLEDVIILKDGESTLVRPNQFHLFEALQDTEFMELYYPEPIGNDIIRENTGSVK